MWELDVENRKIRPTDVTMGQVKRTITCLEVSFVNNLLKILSNVIR